MNGCGWGKGAPGWFPAPLLSLALPWPASQMYISSQSSKAEEFETHGIQVENLGIWELVLLPHQLHHEGG